ncbi:hypothetical protein, partial [Actinobacillus minor]|uniref:hypothetical protein n=1 Tax=Actinobacillus minor TaxID=51047 RepID=UPI0026EFE76B
FVMANPPFNMKDWWNESLTHSSVAPPLDYIGWQRHPIMLNRLRQSRCRGCEFHKISHFN